MDNNSKSYSRDHYHHKINTNSQKSKQSESAETRIFNSLKSHDSGMNDDNSPNYDSNLCSESNEYLTHEVNRDDLRTQLRKSNEEREKLRLQIQKLFAEKDETCKHIAAISQAHENKITEMHCVIVELSKKLKTQQDNAIMEEPEGSASELSFQECSIVCDSDSVDRQDESDFETKDKVILGQEMYHIKNNYQQQQHITTSNHAAYSHNYSSQIQCMQEEILQLRAKVALLKSELACKEKEILLEYEDEQHAHDHECKSESNEVIMPNRLNEFHESISEHYKSYENDSPAKAKSKPVAKVAERVKLRTALEESFTAKDKMKASEVFGNAEQMLASLDEIERNTAADETYRLCRHIEQLKIQNSVLSLNLAESKQHCNHLYLLCGKYESNAVALQQALNCSDRAIEAYDVMLALLESKLAITEDVESASQNRKVAESVAHSLLERLRTENSFYGKSTAPWQESMVFLPDSENMPWTEEHDRMLRSQVSKLKGQRSFIQNTVVNLESPFNLEENVNSSRTDLDSTKAHSDTCCKSVTDIESAIMMQEMMSLREEVSTAKHRASHAEKEKKLACEKLKSMQSALFQLQSQLSEFGSGSSSSIKDRLSYSESAAAEYNASLERELLEALSRECRLKNRLQGLVSSLEVASKASLNPSTKHNVDLK